MGAMRRRDFRKAIIRLHTISREEFSRLFADHHDADRAWIIFQRSPADFYIEAEDPIHEGLWNLVRS